MLYKNVLIFQMIFCLQKSRNRMKKLGLFSKISLNIDVCKDDPYGYEATFRCEEFWRVGGGVMTNVGTNEGSVVWRI